MPELEALLAALRAGLDVCGGEMRVGGQGPSSGRAAARLATRRLLGGGRGGAGGSGRVTGTSVTVSGSPWCVKLERAAVDEPVLDAPATNVEVRRCCAARMNA
ncbi:MAG: hypothetical protein KF773_38165 [Deltaproteobacteria bacterium]|nr:hypothetical protein [Deltaproteobacteria bacterium]